MKPGSGHTAMVQPSPRSNGDIDFASELSSRTRRHHAASDSLVNLTAPLALSSPRVYRLLLAAFYHVFRALETELDACRRLHPRLSTVHFAVLQRTAAFEADLIHYFGHDFRSVIPPPGAAVRAYISELRAATADEPVLLVAYVHSLYLALLAGGGVLSRWLVTAFSLTPPTGVAIFDFPAIADRGQFRADFRDAINSIPLSRSERERIIAQKMRVFDGNDRIFREVASSVTYRWQLVRAIFLALFCGLLVLVMMRWILASASAA